MTLWLVQSSFCKLEFLSLNHLYYFVLHLLCALSLHLGSSHPLLNYLNLWIFARSLYRHGGLCRPYNNYLIHLCLKLQMRFTLTLVHMLTVLSPWHHLTISFSLCIATSCLLKARSIIWLQFYFRSPEVTMDFQF